LAILHGGHPQEGVYGGVKILPTPYYSQRGPFASKGDSNLVFKVCDIFEDKYLKLLWNTTSKPFPACLTVPL